MKGKKRRSKINFNESMESLGETKKNIAVVVIPQVLLPGSSMPVTSLKGLSAANRRLAQQKDLELGVLFVSSGRSFKSYEGAIGTMARVTQLLKISSQETGAVLLGQQRFRVRHIERRRYGFIAHVDLLKPKVPRQTQIFMASTLALRTAVSRYLEQAPEISEDARIHIRSCDDPGRLSDLVASHLSLSQAEQKAVLDELDVRKRMRLVMGSLRRELELLELATRIHQEVEGDLHEHHRREYLLEQMRTLKRELGDMEGDGSDLERLRNELFAGNLPQAVANVAREEFERLESMSPSSPDHQVGFHYLKLLAELPWGSEPPTMPHFQDAECMLQKSHYGLEEVKETVLEYLAVWIHQKSYRGQTLLLNGPPGVGKTSLAQSIAKALGRPFVRVSLGGVKDEAEIRGHRRTYIGAMPGKIIQGIKSSNSLYPVMLLDEVDKVAEAGHGAVEGALLELLDPQQNQHFMDHFLGAPFDLSRVLFVATANQADVLHPAILDRMQRIDVPAYTEQEKVTIAHRHLLSSVRREFGLRKHQFHLGAGAIRALIRGYTQEAGVRQLRREIEEIGRKRVRAIMTSRKERWPSVSKEQLRAFLGPPRFQDDVLVEVAQPGVAVGLAYTDHGGDVLVVEASRIPVSQFGEPRLQLTGHLGAVMRESAHTALTYLRAHGKSFGLSSQDFEGFSYHLHIPDGATPKDGPSAGLAMVAALASIATGRTWPSDVAMTGEVTLRGPILPVGGIRDKVLAALRHGRKHIIVPADNYLEVERLPADVRRRARITFVRNIEDALAALGYREDVEMPVGVSVTHDVSLS